MENSTTAVSLSRLEFQALIDLVSLSAPRLTMAEKLYYDGLLTRIDNELTTQETDMHPAGGNTSPDV